MYRFNNLFYYYYLGTELPLLLKSRLATDIYICIYILLMHSLFSFNFELYFFYFLVLFKCVAKDIFLYFLVLYAQLVTVDITSYFQIQPIVFLIEERNERTKKKLNGLNNLNDFFSALR